MSLSLLTREYRLAHSSAGDLVLVACVFVVALTYLEVPFWNALLFGPAITFQASVGVVVLTRLIKGVPGSLLLLMGPGLILGGALSFAVFQLVGRGMFGLLAVLALGVGAVATLIKATAWQPLSARRMWTVGQIAGIAALALTWEFPELLPVAAAFFVLGFFTTDSPKAPRWLAGTAGTLAFVAIAIVPLLRQDYWWLITDDYNFLEVLSQHITRSGPFADWGVMNFSRYHWLSYGWSGLLNELGGRPDTFTTLTRVMPLIYSASLGASLILTLALLTAKSNFSSFTSITVWVIAVLNPLDWSGTSTAGGLSVLASATSIFGTVVASTKVTSALAVVPLILICEYLCQAIKLRQRPNATTLGIVVLASSLITITIFLKGSALLGRFVLAAKNPEFNLVNPKAPVPAIFIQAGLSPTFVALLLSNFVLIAFIVFVVTRTSNNSSAVPPVPLNQYLAAISILFLLAILSDAMIFAEANSHEYFSAPFYLLSSFAILGFSSHSRLEELKGSAREFVFITLVLTIAGLVGTKVSGSQLLSFSEPTTVILGVLSNNLTGAVLAAVIWLTLHHRDRMRRRRVIFASFSSIVLLMQGSLLATSVLEFRNARSSDEIERTLGTDQIQSIGRFLNHAAEPQDLIATNYLFRQDAGLPYSDYSLAAWSNREYLVMDPSGPWFDSSSRAHAVARDSVIAFATKPNLKSLQDLRDFNVKWFVVDRGDITADQFGQGWRIVFESDRFWVVKF